MVRASSMALIVLGTGLLAGCAGNSSILGGSTVTTSSVAPAVAAVVAPAAMTPKVDPACVALTAQIDTLRKDGVTERIEKVSAGKTKTVNVKRVSLAKMTELDKANAEFQAKCSTLTPKSAQSAAIAPAAVASPTSALVQPLASAVANQASQSVGQAALNKAATTAASAITPAAAAAVAPIAAQVAKP
jgi:hypothetical protein